MDPVALNPFEQNRNGPFTRLGGGWSQQRVPGRRITRSALVTVGTTGSDDEWAAIVGVRMIETENGDSLILNSTEEAAW